MSLGFPIVVDSVNMNYVPQKPAYGGPYESSPTTRYLVTWDGTNGHPIKIYKTVDNGQHWAIVASGPGAYGFGTVGQGFIGVGSCQVASFPFLQIWIAFYNDPSMLSISIVEFSAQTDTFGAVAANHLAVDVTSSIAMQLNGGLPVVIGMFSTDVASIQGVASYSIFDGANWSALTKFPFPPYVGANPVMTLFQPLAVKTAGGFTHVIFEAGSNQIGVNSRMYHGVVGGGSLDEVGNTQHFPQEGDETPNMAMAYDPFTQNLILVGGPIHYIDASKVCYDVRPNGESVAFSLQTFDSGETAVTSTSVCQIGSIPYIFFVGTSDSVNFNYRFRVGVAGVISLIGTNNTLFSNADNLQATTVTGISWAIVFTGTQDYWELAAIGPTVGSFTSILLPVILPDMNILCDSAHVKRCFEIDKCGNQILRSKSPMTLVDYNSLQVSLIMNQTVPQEGPRAIPMKMDFTSTPEVDVDIGQLQQRGFMSMVQSVFVDMNNIPNPLTIVVNGTGQNIVCKPNTQGYYTILCPNPVKLQFQTTVGSPIVTVFLCNSPIPGNVWPTV
jgi:hypothetical protein